ncbi:MAG TPA: hypothetical protein VFA93_00795 [Patescibacteria group bacterium]|nr:hypothetical protein [Patescibacteria group bacterium]
MAALERAEVLSRPSREPDPVRLDLIQIGIEVRDHILKKHGVSLENFTEKEKGTSAKAKKNGAVVREFVEWNDNVLHLRFAEQAIVLKRNPSTIKNQRSKIERAKYSQLQESTI